MEWSNFPVRRPRLKRDRGIVPFVSRLEDRTLMAASVQHVTAASARRAAAATSPTAMVDAAVGNIAVQGYDPLNPTNPTAQPAASQLLTTSDVQALLERAGASVNLNNAIIAVVDRNGTILGVRVESGVSSQITDNTTNRVFAIDGAVSLARTGAYFGNDQAPLTSRTIQEISQTTITQREVQSNPNVPNPNGDSTLYGPGFVAPVGVKGHFPPGIMYTPQVDLYGIESTNRDTLMRPPARVSMFRPPISRAAAISSPRSRTVRSPASCPRPSRGASRPCPVASRSTRNSPTDSTRWSAASASFFQARPAMPLKRTRS